MKNSMVILRGRIYAATSFSARYYVVVSNNPRNYRLPDVLAVPLTEEALRVTATVVVIPEGEPFVGRALCDNIDRIPVNDFVDDLGPLSHSTMQEVNDGIRTAMGLY